jgi:hypothetical protein
MGSKISLMMGEERRGGKGGGEKENNIPWNQSK